MNVLVVLVARHRLALKTFEGQGTNLLDKSRMPQIVADRVSLVACTFDPERARGITFEKFLSQGGCYIDAPNSPVIGGVVVLYEASLRYLLNDVRDAVFAAEVPDIGYVENIQNFLIGRFLILLGNYGLVVDILDDSTRYQAASLPIQNFDSEEFRDLVRIVRESSLERTFQNQIIPGLSRLVKLRGPKRRSNYPHVYFKDARDHYFKYGHEHHSKYETGGLHTPACVINGKFRFGSALDQDRHFNVSIGDSDSKELISCQLPNCHGEIVSVKNRTHVNMFSNDFHK